MASLHVHIQSPLTTHHHYKHSPPSQIFAKPSPHHHHLLLHANKRASNAKCSSGNPKTTPSSQPNKLDRRNVLLGLGGAYGLTTIAPSEGPALANPIQPPVLDKCSPPTDLNTHEVLDVKCCLTSSTEVTDYRLPAVSKAKIRPSAHKVSREYIDKYNSAVDRMRNLPADDPRSFMQQANIHCAYCNNVYDQPGQGDKNLQVHFSWLFFPFHRWYLYFYERILGKLIGDPTFALPFWNWDNPKGMTIPPMFWNEEVAPALYDAKREPSHNPNLKNPAVVDLGSTRSTDTLQVVTNNLTVMHTEMIRGNSSVIDFMGCPVREGGTSTTAMQGTSERGSHTAIHVWVGDKNQPHYEDMGNFYSAGRDPLFYCHHGNVDRMWALWQRFLPNPKIPDKEIRDPDYLNSSFLFYDEEANLVRVFVKDCIDYQKMGYDYERIDLPWIDYRPPRPTTQARAKRSAVAVAASKPEAVLPLSLEKVTRFVVQKTKKGAARERLELDLTVDITKLLKVDVFMNDEDDKLDELDKAAYAGTYAQVPHQGRSGRNIATKISLSLTSLYEDMDVADDDTVVITLVPRHEGPGLTVGGIKIVEEPEPDPSNIKYTCASA